MRKLVVAATIAGVSALTACGSGGAGTQAVHGQVLGGTEAAATVYSAMAGVTGICGHAVEGTQVLIKGASGQLLATTALHEDAKATSALNIPSALVGGQVGVYDFSATIPGGSGPYTVDVVGVSSLTVSAAQLRNLQLTC